MKLKVDKVTARPFLIPAPDSNDDPLFTVIAHFHDTSLAQFHTDSRSLPRPGFFQRLFHPSNNLGVAVIVTRPDSSTFNAICRFKSGQFRNTFDLIFPPGTKSEDVPQDSSVEILRFEWAWTR